GRSRCGAHWKRRRPRPRIRQEGEVVSSSVLDWFRFQFYFAIDDVHPKGHGGDMIFRADEIALLLDHRFELLHGDVRQLAELELLPLDLAKKPFDLLAVRARRYCYIRIGLLGRYALGWRSLGLERGQRGVQRGRT